MDVVAVVAAIPLGLLAGGFVTMLVDRIPDKTPLTLRSRCPFCEAPLATHETVPVASWVLQRGKCRHCGDPITPAYPFVEVATAALWVAVALRFGWEWVALPPLVLVTALMALSVVDLYVYRLPDRITFPAIGISIVVMVVAAFGIDRPSALGRAAAGMGGYFVLLLITHLISPKGMGFGDVKLALLLGLHLGWAAGSVYVGWSAVFRFVFWALLIASVIGVAGGLVLALSRRLLRRRVLADPEAGEDEPARLLAHSFPFGPALAAGTVLVVLFSETVANA